MRKLRVNGQQLLPNRTLNKMGFKPWQSGCGFMLLPTLFYYYLSKKLIVYIFKKKKSRNIRVQLFL